MFPSCRLYRPGLLAVSFKIVWVRSLSPLTSLPVIFIDELEHLVTFFVLNFVCNPKQIILVDRWQVSFHLQFSNFCNFYLTICAFEGLKWIEIWKNSTRCKICLPLDIILTKLFKMIVKQNIIEEQKSVFIWFETHHSVAKDTGHGTWQLQIFLTPWHRPVAHVTALVTHAVHTWVLCLKPSLIQTTNPL